MALIRGHHAFDDHYTQIPNDWVRDDRLSLEARGLLAQIMSHRPGWNLSIKSMAARNRIGRDKVKRILDELLSLGYLERSEKQSHDENGHLAGYDYTTRDPQGVTQEPCKVEPVKAEPAKADRPPKKTIPIEKQITKKKIDIEGDFDAFWSAYPKKDDKPLARRSYEKALGRATADVILAGAERYRDDPNRDPAYTKNPSTWLNADAWENGPLPAPKAKKANWESAAELARKYRDAESQPAIEYEDEVTARAIESDATSWLKGVDND
jgi:hypothetical protein